MLDRVSSALSTITEEYPLLELAILHHRNTRGQPMSFASKPYLIEPYADAGKLDNWVVRKAVQTGWSEWCIQWSLERAGWSNRIVAYILPTYSMRDRFVQQRIDPLLLDVPAYRHRAPGGGFQTAAQLAKKAAGNKRLKKFGGGTMMFLGSNSEVDFVEFSADVLVVDENDKCDAANLAKARDRVRASPYAQQLRLGNPTMPRIGISRLYEMSDGRHWFHQCPHCGTRQPLDWFLHFVERDDDGSWVPRDRERWKALRAGNLQPTSGQDLRPVCMRCKKPWHRVAEGGLWVPERPMKQGMRGYTCSRMDILDESVYGLFVEWLAAQADPEALSTFYCSVLGIPYEFEGARLSSAHLEACLDETLLMDFAGGEHYRRQTVVAGVDIGAVLHVTLDVITGHDDDGEPVREGRLVMTARTFEEVADIFRRYCVDVAVVDAAPELHKAQELRDTFIAEGGTVVWLCRFSSTPRAGTAKYGMKLDYQAQIVTVDRTSVFDVSFEDIRQGRRKFPADAFSVLGWSDQMKAPVRVVDHDKGRIVWTEGNAADHYRCSDVYARVAYDLLQQGGTYGGSL